MKVCLDYITLILISLNRCLWVDLFHRRNFGVKYDLNTGAINDINDSSVLEP